MYEISCGISATPLTDHSVCIYVLKENTKRRIHVLSKDEISDHWTWEFWRTNNTYQEMGVFEVYSTTTYYFIQ